MASQAWVAERVIPLLKKKPSMGPKAVQEELQDKYNIEIPYQTIIYGRQRAVNKLFGKWDDSFDWLYRFKVEVEMRSPGSILETVSIPTMTAKMQKDMGESTVPVDDNVPEEPMFQWDRDNPDMSVGVCYPSMDDF